jgi:predicted Abi (CAAX) family protease
MGLVEAFLGAAVAGLGFLLASVAFLAWRHAQNRKMAVLGAAFVVAGLGGAVLLGAELLGGPLIDWAPLALAGALFLMLLLLYGALFAKRQ